MENRIKTLISKHNITIVDDSNLSLRSKPSNEDVDFIKANKQLFIDYIKSEQIAKEKVAEERKRKIDAIEGLTELENAIDEHDNYQYEIERRMQNENLSSFLPEKPKSNIEELKIKYPRATAYLTAKNWSYASNVEKMVAGRKALERIINGENFKIVLEDMEAEWLSNCKNKIWD